MSARSIADNGWVKLAERVAVVVLAGGLGFSGKLLFDLKTEMTKITTVQQQVLVPGLTEVKGELGILTDNLLNQPRFDKNDGQRLDDAHRKVMDSQDDAHRKVMEALDERIRRLEAGRGWAE